MRLRPALVLATLLVVAGCAPAVDLRVPAYEGPRIESGRLLVVQAGPVLATPGAIEASGFADSTAFATETWAAVLLTMGNTLPFTGIQSTALPDSVSLVPFFVSRQVVTERGPQNRWERQTLNLPSAPIATGADYVLVLDTVRVDRRLGTEPVPPSAVGIAAAASVLGVMTGMGVVVPTGRTGRGLRTRAPYVLYRAGTDTLLVIGELTGFGLGPDGVEDESAWARSVRSLVESLGATGAVGRR